MDKIKVNNQVVSMRKFVKQAKIHAINKCTKQIKFLEKRKGSEEQMAKTKRKLERLLEEVNILKKIKPDTVSKLALSKAKDWKAVLAEKNIPLEERCFAMLATHPPVQESVEKFHNDCSELIPKIPELVKEWEGKKTRRSEFKKIKQKGKQNNANDPNTLPLGNKNSFHSSNKVQGKCQNFESLENLPNSLNDKIAEKVELEQKLKFEKATKRKVSSNDTSEILDSSTPSSPNKKMRTTSDAESDESDNDESDSFSDNSDSANHLSNQTKGKISVNAKTEDDQSYKNSQQSKESVINSETNLAHKKVLLKKEAANDSYSGETKVESNKEENSEQSQDIRSKLLEISMSKTKMQSKPRSKPSTVFQRHNVKADSDDESSLDECANVDKVMDDGTAKTMPSFRTRPEVKNKIKAITMLDLNELQDVDEIPIEKSDSDVEDETDEDSGKQKKDPFFLRDGQPVSESDEDESVEKEAARKRDFPSFKKKPYDNFNKRVQRDDSFKNRKFDRHSVNGKNSNFKESNFLKNKESSFKNNNRNFKQAFNDNSEQRQNKNFKFGSKDKFNNRNGSNNFTKDFKKKTFSQNHNRNSKWNSPASKPNLSNSATKNKSDDKPLHPSWEAKKKLKEASNMKFQGKRMVFND